MNVNTIEAITTVSLGNYSKQQLFAIEFSQTYLIKKILKLQQNSRNKKKEKYSQISLVLKIRGKLICAGMSIKPQDQTKSISLHMAKTRE